MLEQAPTLNVQQCLGGDVIVRPLSMLHTERLEFLGSAGTRLVTIEGNDLGPGSILTLDLVFDPSCANGLELVFQNRFGQTHLFTWTRNGDELNAILEIAARDYFDLRALRFTCPARPA